MYFWQVNAILKYLLLYWMCQISTLVYILVYSHSNITFHGIYMCCIILYKNDVRFAFYSICSHNRYAFLCFVWCKSATIADKIVSLCIAITHRAKRHQHSRFVMFVSLPPSLPLSLSSTLSLSPIAPSPSLPPSLPANQCWFTILKLKSAVLKNN